MFNWIFKKLDNIKNRSFTKVSKIIKINITFIVTFERIWIWRTK